MKYDCFLSNLIFIRVYNAVEKKITAARILRESGLLFLKNTNSTTTTIFILSSDRGNLKMEPVFLGNTNIERLYIFILDKLTRKYFTYTSRHSVHINNKIHIYRIAFNYPKKLLNKDFIILSWKLGTWETKKSNGKLKPMNFEDIA